MIRIIKDKRYAVPYERWEEYEISAWLNGRNIDSYFDCFVTSESTSRNAWSRSNRYTDTNFVCFKNEEDALAFTLVFG